MGKVVQVVAGTMILAALRFLYALIWYPYEWEGMSLRPFGADGVVGCDGGEQGQTDALL